VGRQSDIEKGATRKEREKQRENDIEDERKRWNWKSERWIPKFCYTVLIYVRIVHTETRCDNEHVPED
jgi:hypothetical protein